MELKTSEWGTYHSLDDRAPYGTVLATCTFDRQVRRTRDGGATWEVVGAAPATDCACPTLVGQTLFAVCGAQTFRSEDLARTWAPVIINDGRGSIL